MNRYALRQRVANMQDEPPDRAMEGTQVKRENIFLFVPNLIGKLGGVTTDNLILISKHRLHPNHPRHNLPLLHASALSSLQCYLHHIMSAGRLRRLLHP